DEKGGYIKGTLETNQPGQDLTKQDLLRVTHHPLLVTVCFKKEGLVLPAEIFEVFNVDTFLISLMGEVGKAKFQSNILPSQYRFRTEGLWSKKLRYKKLRAKILTYHKLSKYFN